MTIFSMILIGVIPAVLVILGGWLILRSSSPDTANRRFLFYLFVVGDGLLLVEFVIGLVSSPGSEISSQVPSLSMPTSLTVLALILTRLKSLMGASRKLKILALILGLGNLGLLVAMWTQPNGWAQDILVGAVLLAVTWMLSNRFEIAAILLSLACLAGMAAFNSADIFSPVQPITIFSYLTAYFIAILPGVVVVLAASLIHTGLKRINKQPSPPEMRFWKRGSIVLRLLLGASLLAHLAFTAYWVTIWDQTSDGIVQAWLLITAIPVAIGSGLLMGLAATGWRRLAGLAFSALVPLLLIVISNPPWGIYKSITEQRAAAIQTAVESFHGHNGRYPSTLQELVPRELLWIPDLIMLKGENWCYQGGNNYYRLSSVFRESFSSPLSYRVYASAGAPPPEPSTCEKRLADLKARYDPQPVIDPIANSSIASEPTLPASQVSIPRTPVRPLFQAASVQIGSWSRDGQFFLLGLPEVSGKQLLVSLNFLDSRNGQLCDIGAKFSVSSDLHDRYAWLADGRLLFLSADGDLMLITPCQSNIETLTARYPETFTQILTPIVNADRSQNEKILLKSEQSYWLLDGNNLQAKAIPDVTPGSSYQQWNTFSWSQAGDRLALSQVNRNAKKPEGTIFIITADDANLMQRLDLPGASADYSPSIEWVSDHELLASGQDTLSLIDLQANPPKITNVFKNLFSLDIAYPRDISSLATIPDPSGKSFQLAVRINHPRNQSIYIYHSDNGKVEILNPTLNALLFFSGGDWAELSKLEDMNNLQDRFELYWPDTPEKASQILDITGHLPRNYPSLSLIFLAEKSQILVSSSQGISRVSVPDGQLLDFWELTDQKYHMQPAMLISPDHRLLVAYAEGDGVYTISLAK
jgi:hypothetical protein